jgi:hypothetical protein
VRADKAFLVGLTDGRQIERGMSFSKAVTVSESCRIDELEMPGECISGGRQSGRDRLRLTSMPNAQFNKRDEPKILC